MIDGRAAMSVTGGLVRTLLPKQLLLKCSFEAARLLTRLTAARPDRRNDPELRGVQLALKAIARRIRQLTQRGTRART